MIKAIIFDFDGVILNSVNLKTDAFEKIYSKHDDYIRDTIKKYHLENGGLSRTKKFRYFEKVLLKKNLVTNQDINDLCYKFEKLLSIKILKVPFIKGAYQFLKKNHLKYDLYISTGTPQKEINQIVKKRKLNKYFVNIYGSPVNKKTHIKNILEKGNLKKNEVIFVGDAKNDYEAAKKANIRFIGVGYNMFFSAKKVEVIRNLSELENIIKKSK